MSHHGHPIAAAFTLGFCAFLWYARGQAFENNKYLSEKTEIEHQTYAFSDLPMSRRFYDLALNLHDPDAALVLFRAAEAATMAVKLMPGSPIAVERQQPPLTPGAFIFICVRPNGDPTCYWAPAIVALKEHAASQ